MENTTQTAADILNSAAWNLENNIFPWGKGSFYQFLSSDPENTECQMCAHGAIGYCGSDEIKKLIGKKEAAEARDMQQRLRRRCARRRWRTAKTESSKENLVKSEKLIIWLGKLA